MAELRIVWKVRALRSSLKFDVHFVDVGSGCPGCNRNPCRRRPNAWNIVESEMALILNTDCLIVSEAEKSTPAT